jgi:hypothetical protein
MTVEPNELRKYVQVLIYETIGLVEETEATPKDKDALELEVEYLRADFVFKKKAILVTGRGGI